MTSTGRVARLTALALATGTLVAAGSASAATTPVVADKVALHATTSGSVLQIDINLPDALPEIPGVGRHITQTISLSDGEIANGSALTGLAHAALGKGTVTDLVTKTVPLDLFPEATSTLTSPTAVKKGIDLSNPTAGLTLKVLDTTSLIANPDTVTSGVLSRSHTALDDITVGAPGLAAALPNVLTPVTNTLQGLVGTVPNPAGPVNDAVGTALGALKSTPAGGAVDDAAIKQTVSTLTGALTGLQKIGASVTPGDNALINIQQLTSDQGVTRNGGLVTSSSANALNHISLLSGLIKVDALQSGVTAWVNTATKKADVAYVPESKQIVKVHVAGVLDLILDATGLHLEGLPSALPAGQVTDTVNAAVQQLLDAAKLLGIVPMSGSNAPKNVAADGSAASGAASGAGLIINPLGATKPLIALHFVNSAAGVRAMAIHPPTKINRTADSVSASTLPRTGANLPLTGAAAVGLIGLAMVARRRRLAQISE